MKMVQQIGQRDSHAPKRKEYGTYKGDMERIAPLPAEPIAPYGGNEIVGHKDGPGGAKKRHHEVQEMQRVEGATLEICQ